MTFTQTGNQLDVVTEFKDGKEVITGLRNWRYDETIPLRDPQALIDVLQDLSPKKPIDAILFCPNCKHQHIDKAEPDKCETCGGLNPDKGIISGQCICPEFKAWLNPPHKSHRCKNPSCNTVWRPADVETNGVAYIKPGSNDTWIGETE